MQRNTRFATFLFILVLLAFVNPLVNGFTSKREMYENFEQKGQPDSFTPPISTVPCQDEDSVELIIGVSFMDEKNYEKVRALIAEGNGVITDVIAAENELKALVADVPHETVSYVKRRLLEHGLARYVEPNMRLKITTVPNDPGWRGKWGLRKIWADYAWNTTTGDPSVVIAIVDTGVDWNHPDLAANIWNNTDEIAGNHVDDDGNGFVDDVRGWDFVDTSASVYPGEDGKVRDNDPMDFHGHGTHCAGIASAVGNNGLGVCGVTWNCKIMAVRAGYKGSDGNGYLELDDAAAAIIYAADNGADIISCSWGSYEDSQIIRDAVEYAYDAGALLVAAAGNDMRDDKLYPAAYDQVIAVSATNELDKPAWFTNFGEWIELAAPGVDINSTVFDDSYEEMSGTSMATPCVAGVAALVWSQFPEMSRDEVRAQLRFTSDDLGEEGFDFYFGYGRVNARKAVELEPQLHDLSVYEINIASLVPLGETAYVNVTVANIGNHSEHDVTVQLLLNDSLLDSVLIPFMESGAFERVSFPWDTSQYAEGHYNLTAYVAPVDGENRVDNNHLSKTVYLRRSKILRVPQDFDSIQEAVNAAFEKDTILVSPGTYQENVYIYKDSIKLVGEKASATIVDGASKGDVIQVWADNVEIRGFTVRNSGRNPGREPPLSGILVYYSRNVSIINVSATSNRAGIFLYCSSNVKLKGNQMKGNLFNFGVDGYTLSHFIHSIDDTNIVNDKPLVYLLSEHDKTVSTSAGCVLVVNSTNIRIEKLELDENYDGVLCMASRNVSLNDLDASLNYRGICVRNSTSITISNSYISESYVGIQVEESRNLTLAHNFVSGSYAYGEGIKIFHSTRCSVSFNALTDNVYGLYFSYSSNNTASFNILKRNRVNLWLYYSNSNVISKNEVSNGWSGGIFLTNAYDNRIIENNLLNNVLSFLGYGIALNIETSFNNAIYHNNFINNTYNVFSLDSQNIFDNSYPSGGNYWSNYIGKDLYSGVFQNETGSDGIGDTPYTIDENNTDRYPLMEPREIRDIKVATVSPSRSQIYLGWSTNITVTIKNEGTTTVGNFTIKCKAVSGDVEIIIGTMEVAQLTPLNTTTATFQWTPENAATYRIECEVSILEGEIDFLDNTLADGTVNVRMVGDVNGDNKVDIKDLVAVIPSFGASPLHPNWNPLADLNLDNVINMRDIGLIAKNFGRIRQ